MKILAIGNSFSQDATRYLYGIAKAAGENWQIANLYIGGCPLEQHFRNMLTGEDAYVLQWCGMSTGFHVSLQQALRNRAWDVITLQQASHFSAHYDTYQPYLNRLAAFIREQCPKARLVIHQTWAYEAGSARLESAGFATPHDMFRSIESAYEQARQDINADGLIPSGALFDVLRTRVDTVHHDTFHASLGLGRYALGLLWYRALTGASVLGNTFRDFDVPIPEDQVHLAQQLVEACC